MGLRFAGLLLTLILFFALAGNAQVTLGTISGIVKDSTGAVMPAAKIEILNEDTGIARTVEADTAGRYTVPALGLGKYRVTASLQGFQSEVRTGIELTVGREAVVNFELQIGAVSQSVEVSGEAPLVESTTASVGSLVDERTIRELPLNGRSYDRLALLQPGVAGVGASGGSAVLDYGTGTRFSVAGSRTTSNSFMLDGTDINDHANATPGGAAGTNLGVDGIREFKALTNTFSADYGRSSGGIVSAVTRSGTNQLHGTVFEFIRNSALDARSFFDGDSAPPFRRNQFGGSLGGPLKKDKLFYFGTYEGLRQALGTTLSAFVPSLSARQGNLPGGITVPVSPLIRPFLNLYPIPNGPDFGDGTAQFTSSPSTPTNENYTMGRVDYQLSAKHSLFGRYSLDQDSVVNPEDQNLPRVDVRTFKTRRQYSTVQLNSVVSAATLNNFLFAYNRSYGNSDAVPSPPLGPEYSFVPGQVMGSIQFGSTQNSSSSVNRTINTLGTNSATPRQYAYNLFEWADNLTYARGKHSAKFGGDFKRILDNVSENTALRGIYTFPSLQGFLSAAPSNFEAILAGQNAYRGYRQSLFAVYGQDDIRLTPRLTANLGLRWEASSDPTEVNGLSSLLLHPLDPALTVTSHAFSVTKKNFEPRIGLAWELNDRATTVLRSGFGIFHDHVLPGIYAIALGKNPPFYNDLSVAGTPTNPVLFPNGITQLKGGVPALILLDPNMKEAAKYGYNLNLQQQILKDLLVEVAYIGSRSNHLYYYTEVNYRTPSAFVNGQPIFASATAPRINPAFGSSRSLEPFGNSNYNAFQATAKRRSVSGIQYQASYTLSRNTDTKTSTSSGDSGQEPTAVLNPLNPAADHGLSGLSLTHQFTFNLSYPLPFKFQRKSAEAVLGGWTVTSLGTFASGHPFTVRAGSNRSQDGDSQTPDRPNLLPGANNNPVLGNPVHYFDATQFAFPAAGTFGNLGRNTITGPGIRSLDLSLQKNFTLTERISARLQAEFFNILNHANFGLPATTAFTGTGGISGSAGRISTTTTSSRQIQFGLKIAF